MEISTATIWEDLVEGNIYMIDDEDRNIQDRKPRPYYYKYKIEKPNGNHMFVFERVNSPHLIFTCTVTTFYFNTGFTPPPIEEEDEEMKRYTIDYLNKNGYTMTTNDVLQFLNCPKGSLVSYVKKERIRRLKSIENEFYYNAEDVKEFKPIREKQYNDYLRRKDVMAENLKNNKNKKKKAKKTK